MPEGREADQGITKTERIDKPESPITAEVPAVAPHARVVCVSVNFAGMEVLLNKPVMVLGRTEDNDVVINHRSISRHHCRIAEEAGRYTIIDLQSANGVRVNGEDYSKIELRRGDLIDLGHVRLRFVAPGEDFVFERDATVVDTSKGGASSSGLWLGVAVIVLLGAAVLIWRAVVPGETPPQTSPDMALATDAAPGKPEAPDDEQIRLLGDLRAALENESWNLVLERCAKLRGAAKERAAAECARAGSEEQWKGVFERAVAKTTQLAYVDALQLFNQIPADSAYAKKRADNPEYQEARSKYLAQMLQAIDALVASGECEEADVKADAVKKLIPDDVQAAAKTEKCEPATATAPNKPRRPKQPRPKVATQTTPQPAAPEQLSPEDQKKGEEWLNQARIAYINANHALAIALARKVLAQQPTHREALQVLGASACFTKNVALAKSAYRRLDAGRRQLQRAVCARNGISLD
jgi:pSer/pThr/pTyr-binding forkhead associated (FHA) protein